MSIKKLLTNLHFQIMKLTHLIEKKAIENLNKSKIANKYLFEFSSNIYAYS
jgi:hypothetical protein